MCFVAIFDSSRDCRGRVTSFTVATPFRPFVRASIPVPSVLHPLPAIPATGEKKGYLIRSPTATPLLSSYL